MYCKPPRHTRLTRVHMVCDCAQRVTTRNGRGKNTVRFLKLVAQRTSNADLAYQLDTAGMLRVAFGHDHACKCTSTVFCALPLRVVTRCSQSHTICSLVNLVCLGGLQYIQLGREDYSRGKFILRKYLD